MKGDWTIIEVGLTVEYPSQSVKGVRARCSCGVEKILPTYFLSKCCIACSRARQAAMYRCPCGATKPARYGRSKAICMACEKRKIRYGLCSCGQAMYTAGCRSCDKS